MPAIPPTSDLNKVSMDKDGFHAWLIGLHGYLTGLLASTGTAADARTALGLATGTASGNVPLVGTKSATETVAGLVELANQAEAEAGTDDTVVMTPLKTAQAIAAIAIDLGTAQASTSGVAIDFTGIPATAKRIVVMFENVSTNGAGQTIIQLGDAGGFETTGYVSGAFRTNTTAIANVGSTAGLLTGFENEVGNTRNGLYILEKLTGNTWVGHGMTSLNAQVCGGAGSKTLSDTLTQLRITTTSGDTFDLGQINISVE